MSKHPAPKESEEDDLRIDAMPTKELFVAMLTRDVALVPAIIDLADNCTDGARRTRGDRSWNGLYLTIDTRNKKFIIEDNAGGMSVDVAKRYAFRFGRPAEAQIGKGEVGRFGVGMKRGLFKIGRHFHVTSTTKTDEFSVTIDVDEWVKKKEWEFEFDEEPTTDGNFAEDRRGTKITVTKLHRQVEEHFAEQGFVDGLRQQLTAKLEQSILKGFGVTVNDVALKAHVRSLVAEKDLAPAKRELTVRGPTGSSVNVELWCGLGKPEHQSTARTESGWYVFCNGRMLLQADKTPVTGWGVEDDESIPAYHPQYNDFRGYAYLDAADAADLPWNTTKTALDTDHPVYRRVKQEMIAIARPVINFFNRRKDEKDAIRDAGETGTGPLQDLIDKAKVKPLDAIRFRTSFATPTVTAKKLKSATQMQRIAFDRKQKIADAVKQHLRVSTWRQVGEEVFDYYYNAELKDNG